MFIITFICYVNPVVTFKNSVFMYETIPFTITWKRKKDLGKICLSKQKTCTLKTKAVMKEIEDDTNRWNDMPCSWIGRISIVKMTILFKAIYRLNTIPIKLLMAFFTELKQKNLKIFMKTQRNLNRQSNPEKEKQSWSNKAPWLKTILQSYIHQNSMVLAQKQTYESMEHVRKPGRGGLCQ